VSALFAVTAAAALVRAGSGCSSEPAATGAEAGVDAPGDAPVADVRVDRTPPELDAREIALPCSRYFHPVFAETAAAMNVAIRSWYSGPPWPSHAVSSVPLATGGARKYTRASPAATCSLATV